MSGVTTRGRFGRAAAGTVVALGSALAVSLLAACGGGDLTASDLPAGITAARPSISVDEAKFVLDANAHGADITGATVDDDIETGTTICWALKNGGVQVKDLVAQLTPEEAPRATILMAAAIPAFCPDYDLQVGQLSPTG